MRSTAEEWAHIADDLIAQGALPQLLESHRVAFYAGASYMAARLTKFMGTEPRSMQELAALIGELKPPGQRHTNPCA